MDKNKRLKKIKSLRKRIKEHKKKIESYAGKNYALVEYWEKEIKGFEDEIRRDEGE